MCASPATEKHKRRGRRGRRGICEASRINVAQPSGMNVEFEQFSCDGSPEQLDFDVATCFLHIGGDVVEDGTEGAHLQRLVFRNGYVVFRPCKRGSEANMAAGLTSDFVAVPM